MMEMEMVVVDTHVHVEGRVHLRMGNVRTAHSVMGNVRATLYACLIARYVLRNVKRWNGSVVPISLIMIFATRYIWNVIRSAWTLWGMEHMVRKEIHRLSPLFLKGVYMIAMITITAIGVYTLFQMVLVVQVHHQGHNHHYHHHL
jgi:hypothetical protein